MRIARVLGVIGRLLRVFCFGFVPPMLLSLWDGWNGQADEYLAAGHFAVAGLVTWTAGMLFARGFEPRPDFRRSEALGVVAGSWLVISVFAAIPYLLAGTSFPLLWVGLTRNPLEIWKDGEFKFYLLVTGFGCAALAFLLAPAFPGEEAWRAGAFQAASLISSTGYASTDYNLWADSSKAILILVMLVGGCAGSAAGGPKAIRNLFALKFVWREITRSLHPRAVLPLRHKGHAVADPIVRAVLNLVFLYLIGYFVVAFSLTLMGEDLVTAFSASLACMGNIGPGFEAVGPMGNFAGFSTPAKLLLTVAMWLGRLEIVTVLALLHPDVLRRLRWNDQVRQVGPSSKG